MFVAVVDGEVGDAETQHAFEFHWFVTVACCLIDLAILTSGDLGFDLGQIQSLW